MDKIQEKFNKTTDLGYFFESESQVFAVFKAGYKAADLLPTEKICPECEGSGTVKIYPEYVQVGEFTDICPICKSKETIQIYYTPAQYEKIMGKPYPDDALVWCYTPVYIDPEDEENEPYKTVSYYYWKPVLRKENGFQYEGVIIQAAQPAPDADYRPEE